MDPERPQRVGREGDRLVLLLGEQREQRLGEAGEVPLCDDRLVAVRIAPARVDRAEDRSRVERIEKGARPVVDGLAGDVRLQGGAVVGQGGQFESLREYVRGDDPRSLDWKASARRGGWRQ